MKAVAASCHRSHPILHVVSVSGGKDSCATLLLALERCPIESIVPIFCDTGHEHPAVYDYLNLNYLERILGVRIRRLKADFLRADRSEAVAHCTRPTHRPRQ